ncbi:MAG: 2-amino-4-hydroxy-6-hydroxymethyldihydropteridine diphosphokinase [Candidatus Melainabacteria bacterium]
MSVPVTAIIGLGSNLGDSPATLQSALDSLALHPDITLVSVSSFYETDPVGLTDQPVFLNAAAQVQTTLSALQLLAVCLEIEQAHGRVRHADRQYGPRTLDLDILLYGDGVIDLPGLSVPHPHLHERLFALLPVLEVMPEAVHPRLNVPLAELPLVNDAQQALAAGRTLAVRRRAPSPVWAAAATRNLSERSR